MRSCSRSLISMMRPSRERRLAISFRKAALALTNSAVRAHAKFEQLLLPYLVHFGIPHTIVDIGKNGTPQDLASAGVVPGEPDSDA